MLSSFSDAVGLQCCYRTRSNYKGCSLPYAQSSAFGRDRGHNVVTETLAIFLVVTGSQDISWSGHGVTGIFLGAVCIISISNSCHSIQAISGSAHL